MADQAIDLEIKELVSMEVKDEAQGLIEAVVATLGVVDKDLDVIVEGAIPDGSKVKMSSYGHDVMYGSTPVGKGALVVVGNKAVFKGRMFLTTARGRETFDVLKEMGADQQWSFGFRIVGSEVPSDEWQKRGARRMLTKLEAFEVSPVVIGAGVGTRTTAVKAADAPPPPPDPTIEAARLDAEAKALELAAINARADRFFKRGLAAR